MGGPSPNWGRGPTQAVVVPIPNKDRRQQTNSSANSV